MNAAETIEALLNGAAQAAAAEERRAEERRAARVAWVKQAIAAMMAAQKRVDEAWARIFAEARRDYERRRDGDAAS